MRGGGKRFIDKRYDNQGVKDKFGVEPRQIIDYLTLMGDKLQTALQAWQALAKSPPKNC